MFVGEVVGNVWSTVKWPELEGLKLLVVRPFHYNELVGTGAQATGFSPDDGVVVADTLDAGVGDRVLVAYGHAARVAVYPELAPGEKPPHPIDAAVVAVVDDLEVFEDA